MNKSINKRHPNFKGERNKKIVQRIDELTEKGMTREEAAYKLSSYGDEEVDLVPRSVLRVYARDAEFFQKNSKNENDNS